MKHFLLGLFTAYSVLVTAYAAGMHSGRIASISQACVEHVGVVPADYATQLERARK